MTAPRDDATDALRDSLARWLADRIDLNHHARADAPPAGPAWAGLASDLGLLGAGFTEGAGGLAADAAEAWRNHLAICETLGEWLSAEPYIGSAVVGGGLLQRAGTATAQAVLAELIDGRALLAWAHAEPGARGDPADVSAALLPGEGRAEWLLHGRKTAVVAAPWATHLVVSARRAGQAGDAAGLDLILLPLNAAGISRRDTRTLDCGVASEIAFDGVAVAQADLLAPAGQAGPAIARALDEAALALCAESLGTTRRLFDATRSHLRERQQFGQPLAAFQVLQHRLADMHIARELAAALVAAVGVQIADATLTPEARALAVSSAKVAVGKACQRVGEQAVQMHGGMGVTEELAVGRFFRRALQIERSAGSSGQHLLRIVSLQHSSP
ncbi:acyl-CoA dehydrogenase family protein [Aquabacterium sp. OR-4]|uniref:acyl-CoA dehydrogenase family protein n=1 Tax=Aquabacterium sp. OR-4 TaxID=2978127 RepID=UPI0021B19AE9|nr:acyl-CoA dehydrogenase [Aquabacterium sp. OR-4]MDT7837266.1 acyl-CoA dehydrogenase [Aquabacterium sp. OR-4]